MGERIGWVTGTIGADDRDWSLVWICGRRKCSGRRDRIDRLGREQHRAHYDSFSARTALVRAALRQTEGADHCFVGDCIGSIRDHADRTVATPCGAPRAARRFTCLVRRRRNSGRFGCSSDHRTAATRLHERSVRIKGASLAANNYEPDDYVGGAGHRNNRLSLARFSHWLGFCLEPRRGGLRFLESGQDDLLIGGKLLPRSGHGWPG